MCWICCRGGDSDVGGDGAGDDRPGIWPACPKGMNENRDEQRTVRTIMPAFKLSEEGKKGDIRDDGSTGGRNDTTCMPRPVSSALRLQ